MMKFFWVMTSCNLADTNLSEEQIASIFRIFPEGGSIRFLENIGNVPMSQKTVIFV
jgi:hypothetical protein